MSEMPLTADHFIVIGARAADRRHQEFARRASGSLVRVRSSQETRLRDLIIGPEATVTSNEPELLEVAGVSSEQIAEVTAAHRIVLHERTPLQASLEQAFMELTGLRSSSTPASWWRSRLKRWARTARTLVC
jgi:ABC-2 type transport system ATP-binding protein